MSDEKSKKCRRCGACQECGSVPYAVWVYPQQTIYPTVYPSWPKYPTVTYGGTIGGNLGTASSNVYWTSNMGGSAA